MVAEPTASSSSFTGTPALARSAIAFANSSPISPRQ